MATMTVPNPMEELSETQAEAGRYSNASDDVRNLILRDQMRGHKVARMQRHVDEAMASGIGNRSKNELFQVGAARAHAIGSK